MIIKLSPVRMDVTLELYIDGDVLTLNAVGVPYHLPNGSVLEPPEESPWYANDLSLDLGPLPNGATLPYGAIDSPWIAGDVTRAMDGTLTVPLILPHGKDAPEESRFPSPITVTEGVAPLPPYNAGESA